MERASGIGPEVRSSASPAPVAGADERFRAFEQAGWEDPSVAACYDDRLSSVTTQSIAALLDAAGVGNGSRVLDVATGAGYAAVTAARRGADAIGVDFSTAQLRIARERHPEVRFEHADAEALPFAPESFDAVVNGFGMCHVPNPDRALREAFRVLRHGGRVAFTVWEMPEHAAALGAFYGAVRTHGSMEVGLPAGPSFFLFSDPEQSTRTLLDAGFVSPACRQVRQLWRVSAPDEVFEAITEGTVRAAATLRAQSASARERIRAALREAIAGYARGDCYEVPMPAMLASATKP
jgi:ubiquinone/menaquinone biosynthesis C-methylase UbiE